MNLEKKLLDELRPKFNTATQHGGWKGMHSAAGLERIAIAQKGRPVSNKQREARRENARKLNAKRYGHAPKIS